MKVKLTITFLFMTLVASACGSSSGKLTIQGAWARPASAGENSAAYFIIDNGTSMDDTLLSLSSQIASATEVHMSMMMDGGVMSMQQQDTIPAPARNLVEFKTGGLHVMFIDLKQDLKIGDTFPLTLNFEKTGSVTIEIKVRQP